MCPCLLRSSSSSSQGPFGTPACMGQGGLAESFPLIALFPVLTPLHLFAPKHSSSLFFAAVLCLCFSPLSYYFVCIFSPLCGDLSPLCSTHPVPRMPCDPEGWRGLKCGMASELHIRVLIPECSSGCTWGGQRQEEGGGEHLQGVGGCGTEGGTDTDPGHSMRK